MVSASVIARIGTFLIPSKVAYRMLKPITHTCAGIQWDLDGPSPSEYCSACMKAINTHSTPCSSTPSTLASTSIEWGDEWARREVESTLISTNDVSILMDHDMHFGIERPWWYYAEMHDAKYGETERVAESLEKYKQELEEVQARQEAMKRDQRAYIRSLDKRSTEVRDAEFAGWLSTPKNRRPIYLQGGKTMGGVAKADTGSVVIRKCPAEVSLADIRLVLAKFGGVRDVYRPTDRTTGAPKPFVFVEMLRNADAWVAADYFAETPFVLDGRTFSVEAAGERKSSTEMVQAAGEGHAAQPSSLAHTPPAPKAKQPKVSTGAFAALADSDSE